MDKQLGLFEAWTTKYNWETIKYENLFDGAINKHLLLYNIFSIFYNQTDNSYLHFKRNIIQMNLEQEELTLQNQFYTKSKYNYLKKNLEPSEMSLIKNVVNDSIKIEPDLKLLNNSPQLQAIQLKLALFSLLINPKNDIRWLFLSTDKKMFLLRYQNMLFLSINNQVTNIPLYFNLLIILYGIMDVISDTMQISDLRNLLIISQEEAISHKCYKYTIDSNTIENNNIMFIRELQYYCREFTISAFQSLQWKFIYSSVPYSQLCNCDKASEQLIFLITDKKIILLMNNRVSIENFTNIEDVEALIIYTMNEIRIFCPREHTRHCKTLYGSFKITRQIRNKSRSSNNRRIIGIT